MEGPAPAPGLATEFAGPPSRRQGESVPVSCGLSLSARLACGVSCWLRVGDAREVSRRLLGARALCPDSVHGTHLLTLPMSLAAVADLPPSCPPSSDEAAPWKRSGETAAESGLWGEVRGVSLGSESPGARSVVPLDFDS